MAKTTRIQGSLFVAAIVAGTLVIAVLLNVIAGRLFARVDLTDNNLNTLSAASREAVADLEELEVTVYISPDLPETVRDESGRERVMRDVAQAFRDKIEEYKSYADGRMTVRYVTGDVVEQAKKANLRVFSGEEATAKEGRLEFKQYAMGATFHFEDAMEVLDLALYPEHYEFEMTRILLRLKQKVEHAATMKDVLGAGKATFEAAEACDAALQAATPEDEEAPTNPFGLLSADAAEKRIGALTSAATTIQTACDGMEPALVASRALKGKHPALDQVTFVTEAYAEGFKQLQTALASTEEQTRQQSLQIVADLHSIFGEVKVEHDNLEDAPGRKSIGFVCAGRAFCPFVDPKPLVPPELEPVMGQQNPFAKQVVEQLKMMQDRINQVSSGIERNLFRRQGFDIAQVNLDRAVPSSIGALVLFGPRAELSQWQLYQLDQFVLGGGSLVVFLNPWDVSLLNTNPKGEMTETGLQKNSANIGALLSTWGITPTGALVAEKAEHDVVNVLSVIRQGQMAWQTRRQFPYPLLPVLKEMDTSSPLVRAISALTLPYATSLKLSDAGGAKVTALVSTSEDAISVSDPAFPLEPTEQLARVQTTEPEGPLVVVATSVGTMKSHFAGKEAPAGPTKSEGAGADEPVVKPKRLDSGEGRVLVIGSNLGLEDMSRETIFAGFDIAQLTGQNFEIIEQFQQWRANLQNWEVRLTQIQHTLNDNIQFLFNVMDWSIQQEGLVEIRSKQYQRRPLAQLEEGGQTTVKAVATVAAPLVFILLGLLGLLARRARRKRLVARVQAAARAQATGPGGAA